MISGNKKIAYDYVKIAVFESLKETITGSKSAWNCKFFESALSDFQNLSETITVSLLKNMSDSGDVPYVLGKVGNSEDIGHINDLLCEYYKKHNFHEKHIDKKKKLFLNLFRTKMDLIHRQWAEMSKQFFKVKGKL